MFSQAKTYYHSGWKGLVVTVELSGDIQSGPERTVTPWREQKKEDDQVGEKSDNFTSKLFLKEQTV